MGKPTTFKTDGSCLTNTTVRAYIEDDLTGSNILRAAISAIAYTVTQAQGKRAGSVTGSGSLSPVATYLTDTLSTTGWTIDSTGYNFQATLPASAFPDPGEYVIDILFTLASDGTTFPVKCFHHALSRS